jgi:K+-transporting ATPase ATPase C chain
MAHLRANVLLVVLTMALCCVLYPLVLWGVGQTVFPTASSGSLVKDKDGNVIGSRLLAQKFTGAKYFQPRPSAVDYNASASGGSNLAANNPKLRGRVAQALGLIARYKKDSPHYKKREKERGSVGPDVEEWFAEQIHKRDLIAEWADANPTLAAEWVKSSDLLKDLAADWIKAHPKVEAAWQADNPKATAAASADDLAPYFFKAYSKANDRRWPRAAEKEKGLEPVSAGQEIRSVFFDTWLNERKNASDPKDRIDPLTDLEQVPADLVTTSGSGLDPHITRAGADYQFEDVVEARVKDSKRPDAEVRETVKRILDEHTFRPLGGLAGERLVNVLEVNLALDKALPKR